MPLIDLGWAVGHEERKKGDSGSLEERKRAAWVWQLGLKPLLILSPGTGLAQKGFALAPQ